MMPETVTVPTTWLWLAACPLVVGLVSLWLYWMQPFLAACARLVTKAVTWWITFWEGVA
jgi:hypothetical protein